MIIPALTATALLGAVTVAPGATQTEIRQVPLVRVSHGDDTDVVGFGLPSSPDSEGLVLISTNGLLIDVPWDLVDDTEEVGRGPVTAVPSSALVQGLAHADSRTREGCHDWLQDQGAQAMDAIVAGVRHRAPEARRLSLKLLAQFRDRKHLALARRALKDPEERVRRQALSLFARLEPVDLASTCLDILHGDRSLILQHDAIVLLGDAGRPKCVDDLLRHLEGTADRSLRLVTFIALKKLTGKNFGREEAQWRAWWTNHRDEVLDENARKREGLR